MPTIEQLTKLFEKASSSVGGMAYTSQQLHAMTDKEIFLACCDVKRVDHNWIGSCRPHLMVGQFWLSRVIEKRKTDGIILTDAVLDAVVLFVELDALLHEQMPCLSEPIRQWSDDSVPSADVEPEGFEAVLRMAYATATGGLPDGDNRTTH